TAILERWNQGCTVAAVSRSEPKPCHPRQPDSRVPSLAVQSVFFTIDYRRICVIADLRNPSSEIAQVIDATLTVPDLGLTLGSAPGPPSFLPGGTWFPEAPFDLPPQRLSRGVFGFRIPMNSLPYEPVAGRLHIEFFTGQILSTELKIST